MARTPAHSRLTRSASAAAGNSQSSLAEPPASPRSRFDRRLGEILRHATEVFAQKGFAAASVRDIARASGTSIAGLYYYFDSKDHLLFLVQQEAFATLTASLEEKLREVREPEQALRIFIANHLEHFVSNRKQAQVLTHESDTLKGAYQAELAALKRDYYRRCLALVEQLQQERGLRRMNPRLAVLSLFGMMNWIYTWYNPAVDGGGKELAEQMTSIFLHGILGGFSGPAWEGAAGL
ncbi:MAG TPA: TetR/AcrR family transcriptional regulator [Terriglobia bacterium]|nr:TetR/AcrR family transcriptional regulator [Terriglobia bacterium]